MFGFKSLNQINKRKLMLVLAVMLLIFVHSSMDSELSGAESGQIVDFIVGIMIRLHIPVPDLTELTFFIRKAAHFTEFSLLGASLINLFLDYFRSGVSGGSTVKRNTDEAAAIHRTPFPAIRSDTWKPAVVSWIAGTLYAVTDELHQIFVPGRSGELRDICVDSAGVLFGVIVYLICLRQSANIGLDR